MTDCTRCGKTGLQPDAIHTCTPMALRLAEWLEDQYDPTGNQDRAAAELRRLHDENERLQGELETERMRLVACSTAALGYFDGCIDEYKSASLNDVLRLRADCSTKDALLRQAREALEKYRANFEDGEPFTLDDGDKADGTLDAIRQHLGETE